MLANLIIAVMSQRRNVDAIRKRHDADNTGHLIEIFDINSTYKQLNRTHNTILWCNVFNVPNTLMRLFLFVILPVVAMWTMYQTLTAATVGQFVLYTIITAVLLVGCLIIKQTTYCESWVTNDSIYTDSSGVKCGVLVTSSSKLRRLLDSKVQYPKFLTNLVSKNHLFIHPQNPVRSNPYSHRNSGDMTWIYNEFGILLWEMKQIFITMCLIVLIVSYFIVLLRCDATFVIHNMTMLSTLPSNLWGILTSATTQSIGWRMVMLVSLSVVAYQLMKIVVMYAIAEYLTLKDGLQSMKVDKSK